MSQPLPSTLKAMEKNFHAVIVVRAGDLVLRDVDAPSIALPLLTMDLF